MNPRKFGFWGVPSGTRQGIFFSVDGKVFTDKQVVQVYNRTNKKAKREPQFRLGVNGLNGHTLRQMMMMMRKRKNPARAAAGSKIMQSYNAPVILYSV